MSSTSVAELRETRIAAIQSVGDALRQMPTSFLPQVVHRFTPGLYSRELRLNAGDVIESAKHRTEHQFAVLAGECLVASDTENLHLKAGHIGVTKPGTKRVIVAVTDLVWATWHATELTDPDAIWESLIEEADE
jgi:hypothetical protein